MPLCGFFLNESGKAASEIANYSPLTAHFYHYSAIIPPMVTERRYRRIVESLMRRQPTFELFLDDVHDGHNLSAILRSFDAVGGLRLFYARREDKPVKIHKTIAQGAQHWVRSRRINWQERLDFLQKKRSEGKQIIAARLSERAKDFRRVDYTKPTLLIVGNEKEGISPEVAEIADMEAIIPMHGMVQSLNVSVATTLILYEMERQRSAAGMYDTPQLSSEWIEKIAEEILYRDAIARRSKGAIPARQSLWLDK